LIHAQSPTGQTRVVAFHVPAAQPMNASIVAADDGPMNVIHATTVALDDALPSHVDFLKIDVEGAERRVWYRMSRTIAANPAIRMFLEVHSGRMPREIMPFMREIQDAGFKLNHVDIDAEIKP
jgi:hypothetical protein